MPARELTILSVRQPWASLLLSGEDWCENRSWNTEYRGTLWIHASGKVEGRECELWGIDKSRLTTSAILGCVVLIDVIHVEGLQGRIQPLMRKYRLNPEVGPDFVVGEYCWIVANPRVLKTPIPAKGKLNLWRMNVDAEQVRELFDPENLIPEDHYPQFIDAEIVVDGKSEVVEYKLHHDIDIFFVDRDEEFPVAFPEDDEYLNGTLHFRAACEMAWELFPEAFA